MEYIAIHSWNCTYHKGSLEDILGCVEGCEHSVDDYIYYEVGNKVNVKLEKKLTIVVKE